MSHSAGLSECERRIPKPLSVTFTRQGRIDTVRDVSLLCETNGIA